ncbi:MAG: response regulator [Syntrophales bacterium]
MVNETDRLAAASILLVDDDPMTQKVEKAMLAHFGCRVDVAGNGHEAIDALSRQRYDMIFMDCRMPGMDGYETTAMIRQGEARSRESGIPAVSIPIVALTGMATDEDRERCLRAGMDDFLSKPFSVHGVRLLLERWIPARQAGAPGEGRAGGAPHQEAPASQPGGAPGLGESPVIDPKALAAIVALQPPGGEDILKKVVALYLDSSLPLMQGLGEALAGKNAEAFTRAVHTLKSSSAYLGALTFSGMCKELEMLGRAGELEGAVSRRAALDAEYARVRAALEKLR